MLSNSTSRETTPESEDDDDDDDEEDEEDGFAEEESTGELQTSPPMPHRSPSKSSLKRQSSRSQSDLKDCYEHLFKEYHHQRRRRPQEEEVNDEDEIRVQVTLAKSRPWDIRSVEPAEQEQQGYLAHAGEVSGLCDFAKAAFPDMVSARSHGEYEEPLQEKNRAVYRYAQCTSSFG